MHGSEYLQRSRQPRGPEVCDPTSASHGRTAEENWLGEGVLGTGDGSVPRGLQGVHQGLRDKARIVRPEQETVFEVQGEEEHIIPLLLQELVRC